MEESVNLYNLDSNEEATPLDCLVMFKRLVKPKGYVTPEELKELVCDWIDYNLTISIS